MGTVFGDGSRTVLTSKTSHVLPVPVAVLGALSYVADAVTGAIGGTKRWKTMPWIVIIVACLLGRRRGRRRDGIADQAGRGRVHPLMAARLVAVVTGVWLMFSPAALHYVDTVPEASDRIAGPVAAALSFVAIWGVARALRWATLPIGLYLIVAPWLLGFPTDAAVSNLAAGVIFVVAAFVRGGVSERYGGGWMSLRDPCPGVDLPARS